MDDDDASQHATGEADAPPPNVRRGTGRWRTEDRAAAFEAYFRTGSRRRARKEAGVPERTLSMWLRDERLAEERRAVQAGILRSVQEDAGRRGLELVEATREAIHVCRKALRHNPDGKTASSLLSALTRARETEDRIGRLDSGNATEISGVALADEDREAFKEWYADHLARKELSGEEAVQRLVGSYAELARDIVGPRSTKLLRPFLEALVGAQGSVTHALGSDVALAQRLQAVFADAAAFVGRVAQHAEASRQAAAAPPTGARA